MIQFSCLFLFVIILKKSVPAVSDGQDVVYRTSGKQRYSAQMQKIRDFLPPRQRHHVRAGHSAGGQRQDHIYRRRHRDGRQHRPALRQHPAEKAVAGTVGQCHYRKDMESGELRLWRDLIHLNCRGQYLQACVWTAFLFGCPVSEITFVPEELDDRDAAGLRRTAQQAVDEFKQEKQG